jgi:hypothetical protein
MNRLSFLKRLGALAVTAIVAEPLVEALAKAHTVTNPDKVIYYNIIHGGKKYTYWIWESEYLKMQKYQKEMDAKLYESLWIGKFS